MVFTITSRRLHGGEVEPSRRGGEVARRVRGGGEGVNPPGRTAGDLGLVTTSTGCRGGDDAAADGGGGEAGGDDGGGGGTTRGGLGFLGGRSSTPPFRSTHHSSRSMVRI